MSSVRGVIIALPKGIQKSQIGVNNEINFSTSVLTAKPKIEPRKMKIEEIDGMSTCEIVKPDGWLRGKKRRLDHLTWEEKLQRKKLKNRVAAQTSRDRKKAKLDELEDTVRHLREHNDLLTEECAALRAQNEYLLAEAERLKTETKPSPLASATPSSSPSPSTICSSCRCRIDCNESPLGSAASQLNPLPQGGQKQLKRHQQQTTNMKIIMNILMLYLFSRSSLKMSSQSTTPLNIHNLLNSLRLNFPLKWKKFLMEPVIKNTMRKIPLKNMTIQKEWWGRHQKMWKPVQPAEA